MQMCHQGDRHAIFQINKLLIGKLGQKGDLKKIMGIYP